MRKEKKKILLRLAGIGTLHSILYLWLVPFVIFPMFGKNGFYFAVIVAVLISVAVLIPVLIRAGANKLRKKV